MATQKRSASAQDQVATKELGQVPAVVSLSAMINEAIAGAPHATVHGALLALEVSLVELKRRAASVQDQLTVDHAPILESIKAL